MRRLPPQPIGQTQLQTSWRDLLALSFWPTVGAALGMLALVVAAIAALRHFVVMRISIMSLVLGVAQIPFDGFHGVETFAPDRSGGDDARGSDPALWSQLLGTAVVLLLAGVFLKLIPRLALREEQEFREGCEGWSWRERARACVLFGAAHLSNVWYPLASVVALSVGGAIFMWWYHLEYRRSLRPDRAAKHAAALHAVYNGIVVLTVATLFLLAIWF